MQCPNCDHEILPEDGDTCPHCGWLLDKLPIKKKNQPFTNVELANIGSGIGCISAVGMFSIGFILLVFAFSNEASRFPSTWRIVLILACGLMMIRALYELYKSNRCVRCRCKLQLQHVSRKTLDTKSKREAYYGDKVQLLKIATYEDTYRCPHCGLERKHTHTMTVESTVV
jgi:hypothetical protein